MDKYLRTDIALKAGADAVLELPVPFATGSAEYFAAGAVSLLDKLGVVDSLCFGSESTDVSLMQVIASVFTEEPAAFSRPFKGASFLGPQLSRGQKPGPFGLPFGPRAVLRSPLSRWVL